jgi:hypothetical protein
MLLATLLLTTEVMKMVRKYTNKIIEMVDECLWDRDELIRDLLNYMSESDVKDFYNSFGFDDEETDEDDGQPDEILEWHDYDPGC